MIVGQSFASSAFSPLSLPGLVGWWDASDTATITSSGGAVSQWADKSPSGYHLTQSTAGLKPTTGSRTVNGRNALDFTGDALRTANGALNIATLTVLAVMQPDSLAGRALFGLPQEAAAHTSPYFRAVAFSTSVGDVPVRLNGTVIGTAVGVLASGSSVLLRLETATGDFYANGTRLLDGTGATVTFPNSVPFIVGANAVDGENFDGLVAEVVVCDSTLSSANATAVEAYLRAKWGTP